MVFRFFRNIISRNATKRIKVLMKRESKNENKFLKLIKLMTVEDIYRERKEILEYAEKNDFLNFYSRILIILINHGSEYEN